MRPYYISYLRTADDGLTLPVDVQRAIVAAAVGPVLFEYVEHVTGPNCRRPKLHAALAACTLHEAQLVIAPRYRARAQPAELVPV